MNILWDCVKR